MKTARFIKFYTPEYEIAEGFVINKLIFNDEKTDIEYKLLTKEYDKKWFSCKNTILDIVEDKMIKLPKWFKFHCPYGIDKLETEQLGS